MAKKSSYEERVYQAVELFNEQKFEKAREKFDELAEINPENIKVHEVLCQIHTHEENFSKAEQEYEIVCSLMRKKGIEIPPKKTFEEVVENLESKDVLEERYKSAMEKTGKEALNEASNAVQLAIHCMKEGRYSEAEKLVASYKEHCSK